MSNEKWKKLAQKHSKPSKITRDQRVAVWQDTKKIIYRSEYSIEPAQQFKSADISSDQKRQLISDARHKFKLDETKITVRIQDSLDAAKNMQERAEEAGGSSDEVAVLNMANQTTICGGLEHGAGAQEENLGRRTNLHRSLNALKSRDNPEIYADNVFRGETCLYSKGVIVIKGNEEEGYQALRKPLQYKLNVISSAALDLSLTRDLKEKRDPDTGKLKNKFSILVNKGELDTRQAKEKLKALFNEFNRDADGNKLQNKKYADILRDNGTVMTEADIEEYVEDIYEEYIIELDKRIDNLLLTALRSGITRIVLSAHGCGAFNNPPKDVAERIKRKLKGEFADCFEEVEFAIISNPGAKDENAKTFADILTDGKIEPAINVSSVLKVQFTQDSLKNIETLLKSNDFPYKDKYSIESTKKNIHTLSKLDETGNKEEICDVSNKGEIKMIKQTPTTKENYKVTLYVLMEGLKNAKNPKINIWAKNTDEKSLIQEAFEEIFEEDPDLRDKFKKYLLTDDKEKYYKAQGLNYSKKEKSDEAVEPKIVKNLEYYEKKDGEIEKLVKLYFEKCGEVVPEDDAKRADLYEAACDYLEGNVRDMEKINDILFDNDLEVDMGDGVEKSPRDYFEEKLQTYKDEYEQENNIVPTASRRL
jgi:uncharacterized protein (TIGR02452 family)